MKYLENGQKNLSDTLADSICSVFPVSRHWLLTGEGRMLADETDT